MASLPTELLTQIFTSDSLTSQDRANISLTCLRIFDIIHPILYSLSTELERASCLCLAAKRGRVDALQRALDAGADINSQAWFNDEANICQWYNEEDKDKQHKRFTTPLHVAAKYDQIEAAVWLLEHGANINGPSQEWCDASRLERYLPRYGANYTSTPLFVALNEKHTSAAELLVSRGAKVVNLEGDGDPAVHVAAANGMNSIIRLLSEEPDQVCILSGFPLPKVFNINSRYGGHTALHYAVQYWPHGSPEEYATSSAIPLLSALGADINAKNEDGEDALTHACKIGCFHAATLLLKAGANPNVANGKNRNWNHQSPLQLACQPWAAIEHERTEWHLPSYECDWDAARAELIEALFAAGAAITVPSGSEMHTFLVRFCLFDSPKSASALLRLGAVDVNSVDERGQTALLRTLRMNSPSVCSPQNLVVIRLLLDHGARLDTPDAAGLDVLQLIINWSVENSKWSTHLLIFLEHAKEVNVSEARVEAAIASLTKDIDPEVLKGCRSSTSPSVFLWSKRRLCFSSNSILDVHEQSPQQARKVRAREMLFDFWETTWGHSPQP